MTPLLREAENTGKRPNDRWLRRFQPIPCVSTYWNLKKPKTGENYQEEISYNDLSSNPSFKSIPSKSSVESKPITQVTYNINSLRRIPDIYKKKYRAIKDFEEKQKESEIKMLENVKNQLENTGK